MSGWIKLHRQILKWQWYHDVNVCRLFMHLLLNANYQKMKFEGYDIMRGQLVTGRKTLAKDTTLSEQQVRTALTKLKSTNEITIKITNKFSIITVVNYEDYQDDNQQVNQRSTSDQPADNQQVTTRERNKEIKKVRTEEFNRAWIPELKVPKATRNDKKKSLERWLMAREKMEANDIIRAWRIYKADFDDPEYIGGFCYAKNSNPDFLMGLLEQVEPIEEKEDVSEALKRAEAKLAKKQEVLNA